MKANNADTATIYADVISAVESCRQGRDYVKAIQWDEIGKVLLNEEPSTDLPGDGKPVRPPKSSYSVVKFNKMPGATCRYDYAFRLSGGGTLDETTGRIQSAIRRQLVKEFLAENPHDSADDVRTALLSWNQHESMITGSAVVMKVSAVRLEYDAVRRRGKIAVRLDGRNVAAAKKWAIENIEELATGKNIALVVGNPPPPGAAYMTGNERTTEDGLLEIEFKTE